MGERGGKLKGLSAVECRPRSCGVCLLNSGWVCAVLVLGLTTDLKAQALDGVPISLSQERMESMLKERPVDRIVKRNLFHATRGVIPLQPVSEATSSPLPLLRGIMLVGKTKGAILQWPSQPEGVFLELGSAHEGCTLRKIENDRVELLRTAGGAATWVGLEEPSSPVTPTKTQFDQLLALRGTRKPANGSVTPLKGVQ